MTFNDALAEAVDRRNQWMKPINIWLHGTGPITPVTLGFDARANTVPPGDPNDTLFMMLTEDTLDMLAECETDEQWNAEVTRILQDQIDRNAYDEAVAPH